MLCAFFNTFWYLKLIFLVQPVQSRDSLFLFVFFFFLFYGCSNFLVLTCSINDCLGICRQTLKMAEAVPEEELTIPRAAMNKMIKEIVPSVRVANEARELILNCCSEFIHLLASEANEICTQQQKKTINAEHILGGNLCHLYTSLL